MVTIQFINKYSRVGTTQTSTLVVPFIIIFRMLGVRTYKQILNLILNCESRVFTDFSDESFFNSVVTLVSYDYDDYT